VDCPPSRGRGRASQNIRFGAIPWRTRRCDPPARAVSCDAGVMSEEIGPTVYEKCGRPLNASWQNFGTQVGPGTTADLQVLGLPAARAE
jgi:hypothetical protein